LTVLIIAHRLSTLSNCDRIVDLTPEGVTVKKQQHFVEILSNHIP